VAILKFRSGMVGKVAANFGSVCPHFHPLQVYGSRATFINGTEYGLLYTSREPGDEPQKIPEPYPGRQKHEIIHSFVDSILHGELPAVDSGDVFRAMSVCFAIEKATHQGGAVAVEYIEEIPDAYHTVRTTGCR
jgi:predicted dehydrogenase